MRHLFSALTSRLRSSNTQEISAAEYAHFYQLWGGSFVVHPDVLRFFHEIFGIPTLYRGYFKNTKCIGAVGTWGPYIAGDRSALKARHLLDKVDFGYPVIYLPIDPEHTCPVLYKAAHLLNHQREQIAGGLFTTTKRMSILKRIPEDLPTGKKEYQIKERRFERLGGTSRDILEFSNNEIVAIYADLFQQRWNRKPHAIDSMGKTIDSLRKFLFGKVLWLDGGPVAIQINYRADTSRTICVDYVNGGVDKSIKGISPGSFLSYINGREACEDSRRTGKLLIYSYGKANTDYKDQWCNRVARGFTGFWLP